MCYQDVTSVSAYRFSDIPTASNPPDCTRTNSGANDCSGHRYCMWLLPSSMESISWTYFGSQMPLAAGFVGILPALGLLDEEKDGAPPIVLSWIAAVGWSCSVAFFGCAVCFNEMHELSNPEIALVYSYLHLYANKWWALVPRFTMKLFIFNLNR